MNLVCPWSKFPTVDQRLLELLYDNNRVYHDAQHAALVYAYSKELYWDYLTKIPHFDSSDIFEAKQSDTFDEFFLQAAAWHDAMYDVSRTDNEEVSAQYFASSRSAEALYEWVVEDVTAAIRASANHWAEENDALPDHAKIFLDADLYELAAPWEVFEQNTLNVIAEYTRAFPIEEVLAGRKKWLKKVLELPKIYWYASHLDAPARKNIERALRDFGA